MQRIAVVGLKEEKQRILSILYDLGVVQIEPVSKSATEFVHPETDNVGMREVLEELLRMRALMAALPPVSVDEGKKGFSSFGELIATSKSVKIDEHVSKLVREQNALRAKLDVLKSTSDLVKELSGLNEDLSIFDLESASAFLLSLTPEAYKTLSDSLGTLENIIVYPLEKKSTEVEEQKKASKKKEKLVGLVLVVPKAQLEKFGSIIQKADLRPQHIPKLKGRPKEILANLSSEQQSALEDIRRIDGELLSISKRNYALISALEEQLSIESRKFEVTNNLGFTNSTFILEGWVPQKRFEELKEALERDSRYTNLLKIKGEGHPPTLLETPKKLRFFESFIRFYSIPEQNEFDPTLIFAFTFPFFFGLMLGDVGYGLSILGISYWILRRLSQHPRRRTIVPRMIRKFAGNIFRPPQFQKLAMAMIPGAIVGIIFGFLFNEYFGFHLNGYLFGYLNATIHAGLPASGTLLDPVSTLGLKTLLLLSGYIGLFEVSIGLVLGMLNGYWNHEKRHILGKLGWLLVAWGIALLGLTVLHHSTVNPAANPIAGAYIGAFVAGLCLIVFGEGTRSIIELPSIISHILSYTRILGILLASVILADVIDIIFEGTLGGAAGFVIFGVIILVFGQLFNLVLAMFEPGVQGARLIYVEFFSKFFHGSGKPFAPFKGGRTYTIPERELAKPAVVHEPSNTESEERLLEKPKPLVVADSKK